MSMTLNLVSLLQTRLLNIRVYIFQLPLKFRWYQQNILKKILIFPPKSGPPLQESTSMRPIGKPSSAKWSLVHIFPYPPSTLNPSSSPVDSTSKISSSSGPSSLQPCLYANSQYRYLFWPLWSNHQSHHSGLLKS